MLKKVDHLGIAVRALGPALALYRDQLGLKLTGTEEVASEKVRVAFLPVGGTRLELLEPTGADSPIARFLERRGEGLHHVCFEVEDLDGILRGASAGALEVLPGYPRAGAGGGRVAFFHPRSTGGVLIELVEKTGAAGARRHGGQP
jgi:methylmalonyl-CoA epimerase